MSKKILSMALAVVMLMSIFAFAASAEDIEYPAAGQAGYRVVSDATVGMPAGSTVTVKVYYVFPEGTDYDTLRVAFAGNTYLAFTDAYTYDTGSRKFGDSYYYMKDGATVNATPALFTRLSGNYFSAEATEMGWTQGVYVQKTLDTSAGSGYTATTGHPVDPECELYSITLTTTRTLTEADTIGIPSGLAGVTATGGVSIGTKAPTNATLSAANIFLEQAVAAPAAAALEKLAGKMRVNGDDATKADLGYIGTSDLGVTVKPVYDATGKVVCRYDVDGDACGITGVGFEVKVDGVPMAATATKIYLNGAIADDLTSTAGFKFLPALTGVDADCLTSTIEMRTYVIKDGSYIYSEWFEYDAATTYSNAKAANMPAIFG